MIQLESASRWYGDVIGLNDVSCTFSSGVTALLGQNGAGKSTMMRLITGQIKPTTGTVRVFDMDPFANEKVFQKLGYCPDIDSFPEHLSGRAFVQRMAEFSGFSQAEAKSRTEEVLVRVGMADRASKSIRGYSKGMRQRIKLAQALVHSPQIILLDEPLNGLDPVGRREFMDVLDSLSAEGKSILVSSHILFEVEQMTRSIVLLHRGRLMAAGDISHIRSLIDRHPHRISIETEQPRKVAAACMGKDYVESVTVEGFNRLEIKTRKPDEFYNFIADLVLSDGLQITSMHSPDNNLESVYRYLVEA